MATMAAIGVLCPGRGVALAVAVGVFLVYDDRDERGIEVALVESGIDEAVLVSSSSTVYVTESKRIKDAVGPPADMSREWFTFVSPVLT